MPALEPPPSITMVRKTMVDLPTYSLPAPFRLRWYEPGDEQAWVRIHELADQYNTANLTLFEQEFGRDGNVLHQRQAYLCDGEGVGVGTASAWFNDDFQGLVWGRVHWVAIVPRAQGLGLAKPLLAAVMQRLAELGHVRAYLKTNPPRLAAISLYLKFGFVPQLVAHQELHLWREVARNLRRALPGID